MSFCKTLCNCGSALTCLSIRLQSPLPRCSSLLSYLPLARARSKAGPKASHHGSFVLRCADSSHHDFFDPADYSSRGGRERGLASNRQATVFFYLNDVPTGGETAFPSSRWPRATRATFETVRAAWQCTHASDASSFSIRSCPAANLIISHCTTDAMRVRIQPSGQRTTGFGIPHSNRSFFIQV